MTENENNLLAALTAELKDAIPQVDTTMQLWDAAVMLPLVETPNGLSVLFQVRSKDLKWQPGDVCFPGGRKEPQDKSPAFTACRELEEEMGLGAQDYTLLGPLNYFYTFIGPILYPYVGIIHHPEQIKIAKDEVASIFTVPVEELLKLEPVVGQVTVGAKPGDNFPYEVLPEYKPDWSIRKIYDIYCYLYGGKRIWGMTGRVLKDFLTKVQTF